VSGQGLQTRNHVNAKLAEHAHVRTTDIKTRINSSFQHRLHKEVILNFSSKLDNIGRAGLLLIVKVPGICASEWRCK
jgi:hypothetical protein